MPELPEVETTRKSLLPHVKGQRIVKIELRRKTLRFPIPDDFQMRVEGTKITHIRRRAKYLLFDLDSGEVMLGHLGMSGSFTVVLGDQYKLKTHDHVLFHLENGYLIVYHDPRRFGLLDILSAGEEKAHKLLMDIGPEPLLKSFSEAYLKQVLLKRKTPIKPTLMDQKIVVGVGNIYASESLFLAGIHPCTPADVAARDSVVIISSIQKTLRDAIASGGSTLRNYVGANGESGYFQHHFNVYNREDLPCVACATPIAQMVQAGRATYFCPHCQKQSSRRTMGQKK